MSKAKTWAGPRGKCPHALAAAGTPPRGVRVVTRGQLPQMVEMFTGLGIGLAIAVVVILILLTAYFESPRLALISVSAVPGVLSGVIAFLLLTRTTLNLESFMGAIMCIGVSVSNSVMLVTFTNEHWRGGMTAVEAAVHGATERLRPIIMTACAMTVGMVPMSLALEQGSQMQAPLGPRGDRRFGLLDVCNAVGRAGDLCPGDGPALAAFGVCPSRRSRKSAL